MNPEYFKTVQDPLENRMPLIAEYVRSKTVFQQHQNTVDHLHLLLLNWWRRQGFILLSPPLRASLVNSGYRFFRAFLSHLWFFNGFSIKATTPNRQLDQQSEKE